MIHVFFLIITLYFLLFNPAFTFLGGIHISMLLWPLVLLLPFKEYRNGLHKHRGLIIVWGLLFIYVLFRTLFGGDTSFLVAQISIMIESILVSYILIKISIIYSVNFERILLIVASIAGTISCVCLIFPEFNEFSKNIQVITNDFLLRFSYRGFGIGEGLTFSYAVILGSICALGICKIKENRWFVLFVPIITIAVMVNARSGFIPIGIASFLFLFYERKVSYYIYAIIFIFVFFICWFSFFQDLIPESTLEWALLFFEELGQGEDGATIDVLMNTTVWPNDIFEWIFGMGVNVFDGLPNGKRTDIGYLIQLCYGGIIYSVLLWLLVWVLVKPVYHNMPKAYLGTLVISSFLENYKGDFLSRNMAFTFFVLIFMYYTQIGTTLQKEVKIIKS